MNYIGAAFADKLRVMRDDIYGLPVFAEGLQQLCHILHMSVIKSACRFIQKNGTFGGNGRGYCKTLLLPT